MMEVETLLLCNFMEGLRVCMILCVLLLVVDWRV